MMTVKKTENLVQGSFQGPVVMIVWENLPERPVKFVSENITPILGYHSEELVNEYFRYDELVHPVDLPLIKHKVHSFLSHNIDAYELHYRIKGKNGEYRWFYDYSTVNRDTDGEVKEIYGYLFDQTPVEEMKHQYSMEKRDHEFLFEDLFMTHNSVMLLMELETGKIVKANLAAERFYGYSVEQLEKMKIYEINTASREEVYRERKKVAEENRKYFEFKHRLKDGRVRDVEVFSSSIPMKGDHLLFSIIHDVTEKKKAEMDLVDAKEEAELANRAKTIFLANMSHEIRTPLHGIHGFTELLKTTELGEKQWEYLNQIDHSGQRLNKIIVDILDISKIESEKVAIDEMPFNIHEVLVYTVKLMRPVAMEKGLEFILKTGDELPEVFYGDPSRLSQVLTNLLDNAIKFTESGYVKLSVESSAGVDKHRVTFAVEDTGIGIKNEDLPLIFEPFTQIDNRYSRSYEGVGLGLKIAKSLTVMMGGKLLVDSTFGIGSTFTATFPMKVEHEPDRRETVLNQRTLERHDDFPLRALVVDDHEMAREVILEILEMRNISCEEASDGKSALEAILQSTYDVVFMDCQMPVMDGYQTADRIREMKRGIFPLVVALTAHAMKGDRERCLSAGMDEYLTKPIDLRELDKVLKRIRKRIADEKGRK